MTTLVTGSAGFIGFHVSRALLERGDHVIGVDNFNDYYDPALKENRNEILEKYGNFNLQRADICNGEEIEKIFECQKIDSICHLAGQAGVRHSLAYPAEYIRINVGGSTNIFEAARKLNVKNITYASSSSVYGLNPVPWSENQNTDKPINPYGASKRALELLAYAYRNLYGLNMTGLRFFTVYGPWGRPDMAYFKFADKIRQNEAIDIYNNGHMKRDFTYIDDIVAGVIAALDKPKEYEVYNLGNHQSEELGKLITLIENGLGKKSQKNLLPMQAGDFLENFADTAKAQRDLGFNPKTSLNEGIPRFISWYKEYYQV